MWTLLSKHTLVGYWDFYHTLHLLVVSPNVCIINILMFIVYIMLHYTWNLISFMSTAIDLPRGIIFNDIALVKLNEPVDTSVSNIATLPLAKDGSSSQPGNRCETAGWGLTSEYWVRQKY